MKEEKNINQLNNFIEGWYINPKVCDNLITYFENSPDKEKGGSLNSKTNKIEYSSRKISTDLGIYHKHNKNSQEVRDYCDELFKVLEKYKKKYKYCHINQEAWNISQPSFQQAMPTVPSWHIQQLCQLSVVFNMQCRPIYRLKFFCLM